MKAEVYVAQLLDNVSILYATRLNEVFFFSRANRPLRCPWASGKNERKSIKVQNEPGQERA